MLKLSPPQYTIDDTAEWIHPADPAWDNDRVEAELERLREAAANLARAGDDVDELRKAAQAKHPVSLWYRGATRFSSTAKITVPERLRTSDHPASAVTIDAYLKGEPTRWVIKPLGPREYRRAMAAPSSDWHVEMVRHGLVRIVQPGIADPIEPERDSTGACSEAFLRWLDTQDRGYINQLGAAIFTLSSAKADGAQGKP